MNKTFYNCLTFISYCFFLLPVNIFLLGFLKPLFSIPLSVGILFILLNSTEIKHFRHLRFSDIKDILPIIAISGIFALVWCMFTGIGGYGYQNHDYVNNNRTLKDLVERSWPIWYNSSDIDFLTKNTPFVYYVGYYLPAGAIGKLSNFGKANLFIFIWSFLQIWVILIFILGWIKAEIGKITYFIIIATILLFITFSGLDLVMFIIKYPINWNLPVPFDPVFYFDTVEFDNPYFLIPSISSDIFWAPQQAIIIWLFMAIFIYKLSNDESFEIIPIIYASLMIISSWGAVGVLPFLVVSLFKYYKSLNLYIVGFSLILFAILALYITSNEFKFAFGRWSLLNNPDFAWHYFFILFFEVFIYIFLLDFSSLNIEQKKWFWLIVILTSTVSFFKVGVANDFVQRVTMPSIFMLFLLVIKTLFGSKAKLRKILLTTVLILALPNAIGLFQRSLKHYKIDRSMEVATFGDYKVKPRFFIEQRLGNPNSFFFKYLSK